MATGFRFFCGGVRFSDYFLGTRVVQQTAPIQQKTTNGHEQMPMNARDIEKLASVLRETATEIGSDIKGMSCFVSNWVLPDDQKTDEHQSRKPTDTGERG